MPTMLTARPWRLALLATLLLAAAPGALLAQDATAEAMPEGMAQTMTEAMDLLERQVDGTGREAYTPETGVVFDESDNVFMRSALAIDFTEGAATVTLPLYRGLSPEGEEVYYIITEASDFDVATTMGINYAPKMAHAASTPGAQVVTVEDGVVTFAGNVDFAPVHEAVAGSPMPFPPAVAVPGAMANAQWSSMAVTPSGTVYNMQMVSNATGNHDRLVSLDLEAQTVTLQMLDGFQGGDRHYYHLVTDVSADLPAVLEKGVYAPTLALIPEVGLSGASDTSALLGFSPVLNGITDTSTGQDQGFASTLANGGVDPINVFPIDPTNDDPSETNNYSPLWDAHVNQWTEAAVAAGEVRRITSFEDLQGLIEQGLVESAAISPAGPGNAFVFGLRPTNAIVNCPVIAQPDRSS
jgi:hypothetical protein